MPRAVADLGMSRGRPHTTRVEVGFSTAREVVRNIFNPLGVRIAQSRDAIVHVPLFSFESPSVTGATIEITVARRKDAKAPFIIEVPGVAVRPTVEYAAALPDRSVLIRAATGHKHRSAVGPDHLKLGLDERPVLAGVAVGDRHDRRLIDARVDVVMIGGLDKVWHGIVCLLGSRAIGRVALPARQ